MIADERNAQQSAKHIMLLIGRLTILRGWMDAPVVAKLFDLCNSIAEKDAIAATMDYHSLTAALLETPTRRVTGDIWKDHVFSELIETPNRFSLLAASGSMDPAVKEAMGHDLMLVQELFALDSQQVIDWICEILEESEPVQRHAVKQLEENDSQKREKTILDLAQSAWLGGSKKKKEEDRQTRPAYEYKISENEPISIVELNTENWIQWGYAEPAQFVSYVADEALAILYRKFLTQEAWSNLVNDLIWFFRKYGTGIFLQYRWFVASDDQFYGIDTDPTTIGQWDALYGVDRAKEKLYVNALSFLHRNKGDNVLLYGAEGMGKTSLITSLTMEPEMSDLRLVFLAKKDVFELFDMIETLAKQPFHFIVLLDEILLGEQEYQQLKRVLGGRSCPENVLLWATSVQKPNDHTLFPLQIPFYQPEYSEFQQAVIDMLARERLTVDEEEIYNNIVDVCKKWHRENDDLSIRSASRLVDRLKREYSVR